jgi:hypothetical protein
MSELARSAATSLTLVSVVLKHPALATSVGLFVLGGVAEVGAHIGCYENRRVISIIMRTLHKGMSRSETEEVLARHKAHFFVRRSSPEGLLWCSDAGGARAWRIEIAFSSDGTLTSARVRTEGATDHPKGMPPDIV